TTKMIIQDVQSFSKTVAKKELDAIQTYQDNTALSKQAFDKYFTSLKALSQVGVSPSASFSMAANFFKDRAEFQASKAEFYIAYSDYLAFIKTLEAFRKPSQFIKDYILESFRFYVYYSVNESSCFLNKKWEEDVVGGARGLSQSETPNVLFNKENGLVWNFVKNYADPFLIKGANGYKPKDALSQSIEFDNAFLEFLNKGALGSLTYQDAYAVKIKAMPISSNTNSKVKPYGSVLELTCLSKPQQLVNYNYPSEDTFNWTSDCSDVNIKILVNDVELIKTYRGKNGFAKFIEDFKGGTKIFKSADFPGNEAVFTSNAIQNISVSYAISGSDKMIKYYQQTPREIPASISQCWTK
ncbi:MAG: type secretion system protein ImpL, partial [Pseudomonadota bacterium]